jgi:competence protein ComEC
MEWQFLKNNPFIRLVIPYILGIVCCYYMLFPMHVCLLALLVFILFTIIDIAVLHKYQNRWITGVLINLVIFLTGCTFTALQNEQNGAASEMKTRMDFRAIVLEPPVEKSKGYQAGLKVEAVCTGNQWQVYDANIAAFFVRDSLVSTLKAGQTIKFTARIQEAGGQQNPFGFNYGQYLKLNSINGTIYLKSNDWEIVDLETKGLKQKALNLRQFLISILARSGIKGNELGVVSALVLGYQDQIGTEVKQAYRVVGATHVLSVSGMHVGIIYIALGFLINAIKWLKNNRLRFLIIIGFLWFYAFLTGLSPSVLRATVMFSFVVAGKAIGRPLNIYNSLAASAFFLLVVNPYLLFNIGFQLSYIAVAGIVFFHPRIYHLFQVKNRLLDKCWELTAVSIAAQIATLPFCLYYFRQFPVYFWLSNLVVSPGASLLIFLSIALLILSPVPYLLKPLGFITAWSAKIINGMVVFISELPMAVINNFSVNLLQTILLGAVIIFGTIWILKKNGSYLMAALGCILAFTIMVSYNDFAREKNSSICVYSSPSGSAIQFVDGKNSWWILQDIKDTNQMEQFTINANQYWHVDKSTEIARLDDFEDGPLAIKNNYFVFGKLKGMIVSSRSKLNHIRDSVSMDYLVVVGQPPFNLRDLGPRWEIKNLIIDRSVPPWIANQWKKDYQPLVTYLVKESGAFISK